MNISEVAKEIIDGFKADGGIINDEHNRWSSLEKRIANALLSLESEKDARITALESNKCSCDVEVNHICLVCRYEKLESENKTLREKNKELEDERFEWKDEEIATLKARWTESNMAIGGYEESCSKYQEEISALRKRLDEEIMARNTFIKASTKLGAEVNSLRHSLEVAREALQSINSEANRIYPKYRDSNLDNKCFIWISETSGHALASLSTLSKKEETK